MKKALVLVLVLFIMFLFQSSFFGDKEQKNEEKAFVAVTSFPLYEISSKLLTGNVEVKKLIPFGVETHTYRPSVKTMQDITNAEIFLFSGLGMEPWLVKTYPNGIDMSQFVKLNAVKKDDHHHHHESDPHYWLNIENMIIMSRVLSEKFQASFPTFQKNIKENTLAYIKELKTLEKEFDLGLQECQLKEIVVNHNAFGYLGEKYGFHSHSVTGLSTDEQASAKKMKEISDLVVKEGIKVVFFESFVSDKVAKTIASQTGAKVDSLQPLANVTQEEAKSGYISLMKVNLEKLSKAMECQ